MLGLPKWAINFMVGSYYMYDHSSAPSLQFGSLVFASSGSKQLIMFWVCEVVKTYEDSGDTDPSWSHNA